MYQCIHCTRRFKAVVGLNDGPSIWWALHSLACSRTFDCRRYFVVLCHLVVAAVDRVVFVKLFINRGLDFV